VKLALGNRVYCDFSARLFARCLVFLVTDASSSSSHPPLDTWSLAPSGLTSTVVSATQNKPWHDARPTRWRDRLSREGCQGPALSFAQWQPKRHNISDTALAVPLRIPTRAPPPTPQEISAVSPLFYGYYVIFQTRQRQPPG